MTLAGSLTSGQLGGAEPPPRELPPDSSLRTRLRERCQELSARARHALAMTLVDDEVDVDTLARTPGLDLNNETIPFEDLRGLRLIVTGPDHGLRRQINSISADAGLSLEIDSDIRPAAGAVGSSETEA